MNSFSFYNSKRVVKAVLLKMSLLNQAYDFQTDKLVIHYNSN